MSPSSMQKLLIIGYVWPEPNSSAAGTRMMQLIDTFQNADWQITFSSPSKLGEHRTDLTQFNVQECAIELNNESFDTFVQTLQPDLVIFDRFMMEEQFGWRIEKHAPRAMRILNTEDLHSLRAVRQQMVKDHLQSPPNNVNLETLPLHNTQKLFASMAQSDLTKREIASIFRCDLTLMISEFEMYLLQTYFNVPNRQLSYLPFLYDKSLCTTGLSYDNRQHFIAIGNFRHDPNWDAVLWLKQAIWPMIRAQLPHAQLHIYGAYPPKKATQLHNEKQGFNVLGWASNAHDVLSKARVCLAPLRFGAGIKGKLAESMLCGTPSITTSIGAESMICSNTDWPGSIENNGKSFAEAAIELYQNPSRWQKAQRDGFKCVQARYLKPQAAQTDFIQRTYHILNNIKSHRQSNFIGAMMNHHHHKSTQYMAQWIEAKNKDNTRTH